MHVPYNWKNLASTCKCFSFIKEYYFSWQYYFFNQREWQMQPFEKRAFVSENNNNK